MRKGAYIVRKTYIPVQHGVASIVVLVYWGQEHSYFPDESELVIARQLAEHGVTLIIGYHPQGVQDHAYFGNTLVLFSLGNILTSDEEGNFCWNKVCVHSHLTRGLTLT